MNEITLPQRHSINCPEYQKKLPQREQEPLPHMDFDSRSGFGSESSPSTAEMVETVEIRLRSRCLVRASTAPSLPGGSTTLFWHKPSTSPSEATEPISIYAVDDVPRLTELYANLLEAAGYNVRTFNDRVQALAALNVAKKRPSLLITDYLGITMPVNQFIQACRLVHPTLRILMASGFNETEMRFAKVKPDRFIQKPFTPDELQQAVRAVLHTR